MTVAIVVYKGLIPVVGRILTFDDTLWDNRCYNGLHDIISL